MPIHTIGKPEALDTLLAEHTLELVAETGPVRVEAFDVVEPPLR